MLRDILLEKYKDDLPPPLPIEMVEIEHLFPPHLEAFLEQRESELASCAPKDKAVRFQDEACVRERDETEALEAATLDLIRLDRYERRARSRQRRAVLAFVNLKLMKQYKLSKGAN
jgi:hypothetical protein